MSDLSTSLSRRPRSLASRRSNLWSLILQLTSLRRQRLDLSRLDDRALNDIGLSRRDAETEAQRRFWDAPQHWMR